MRSSKMSLWLFVGLTTPALWAADISREPSGNPHETQVQARIRTIQQAHAQQRALFENLRFAVVRTTERAGLTRKILAICIKARDGRYHETFTYEPTDLIDRMHIETNVYDGQYYYSSMPGPIDPNHRLVEVSLRDGPAEFGSVHHDFPLFHLLDDTWERSPLTDMVDPAFSETEEGLWCLEGGRFYDPNEHYSLYFDPHKGYALRKSHSEHLTLRTDFKQSSNAIWCPTRSEYRRGDVHSTLVFEDFAFDVAGDVLEPNFPDEAHVRDYTRTNKDYTTTRWERWRTGRHDPNQMEGRFIAGTVVDPNGDPIPRVLIKAPSGSIRAQTLTEANGGFLLELERDGTHSLTFIHDDVAPLAAWPIPAGKRNLKVVLDGGVAIRGRVVRLYEGKRRPMTHVPVTLTPDHTIGSILSRSEETQSTLTDSEGSFQFKPVRSARGVLLNPSSASLDYRPRAWRLETAFKTVTVTSDPDARQKEVEIIVRPNPLEPLYLTGRPAPPLKGLVMDPNFAGKQGHQRVLCFFDAEGGPDRWSLHSQSAKCIQNLGHKAAQWQERGIDTLGILANSLVRGDSLSDWAKRMELGFPLAVLAEQRETVLSEWGITHLPWLVWIDAEGVVLAEGLTFEDLNWVFTRDTR